MPKSFEVAFDNKPFLKNVTGLTNDITDKRICKGIHTITISAKNVDTHYALSKTEFDEITENPLLVKVDLRIII